MNVIEVKSIQKSFGGVKALINGEISVPAGRICGLLGANGSGKSTFSKILSGMLTPDSGEILVEGQRVHFSSPLHAKQAGIVMVHQHLSLIPDFTVWQNINLGHELLSKGGAIDKKLSRERAKDILANLCPGLPLDKLVRNLLPAEQQLVEIAKGLAQKPKLLILDEPTAALEQTQVSRLFGVLKELKATGTSMIFISHRLWEVKEICDYVVVFRNGENVGSINFAEEEKSEKLIVSLITGKEGESMNKRKQVIKENEEQPPLFEVKGVRYQDLLSDISFSLKPGEILGIGGLQGQRQDELMLLLAGLLPVTSGSFSLEGKEIRLNHPSEAIRKGVVLVPGDRHKEGLYINHSILMNIISAKASKRGSWWIPFRKYREEAEEIIDRLSVKAENIDTMIQNLSGGNQQKIVVGKWLPLQPKVLLLSDPAKGVDVQAKNELYDVVQELASYGTAVILFASDNEELIANCDRVLIMYEGKVVEEFKNDELDEQHLVAASLKASLV